MKKVLIGLVAVIGIAAGIMLLLPSTARSINSLPRIDYTEAFDQDETEYFVYFYSENCPQCENVRPYILAAFNSGKPVFVVDMADSKNASALYDWDAHDEYFTRVIGSVVNGEWILNEGESEDFYQSSEGWTIRPNANGDLIAQNHRPRNNREPQNASELEVAGTPSLLLVREGKFAGYGEGVNESKALLEEFGNR